MIVREKIPKGLKIIKTQWMNNRLESLLKSVINKVFLSKTPFEIHHLHFHKKVRVEVKILIKFYLTNINNKKELFKLNNKNLDVIAKDHNALNYIVNVFKENYIVTKIVNAMIVEMLNKMAKNTKKQLFQHLRVMQEDLKIRKRELIK